MKSLDEERGTEYLEHTASTISCFINHFTDFVCIAAIQTVTGNPLYYGVCTLEHLYSVTKLVWPLSL